MKNYWLNNRIKKQVPVWDFQTALGDTIKEKYESLYVKVIEVSNVCLRKTLNPLDNEVIWLAEEPRKE